MNDEAYNDTPPEKMTISIILRLAGLAFLSGALLGQAIDFAYPMFNALHYHNPTLEIQSLGLEFCWWIPLLYGTAAVILMLGHVFFDRRTGQRPRGGFNPSWRFILAGVGLFALQFYGGPFLYGIGVPNFWLFFITVGSGILVWWWFDRTYGGLFMLLLVATIGPLLEFTMVNVLFLYHYTGPDVGGLPLWIVGAYMCGSAPNGNLGRKYLVILQRQKIKSKTLEK